jgi:hypothetical protein
MFNMACRVLAAFDVSMVSDFLVFQSSVFIALSGAHLPLIVSFQAR